MKAETARKMFGSRHNMAGREFQESVNEVMMVFSDSQKVIDAMYNLWKVVETPQSQRAEGAPNEAMIKLMKAMCTDLGIKYKDLPDSYYLKFFALPKNA